MAQERKQFIAKIIDVNNNIHSFEVYDTSKKNAFSAIRSSLRGPDKFLHITEDRIINVDHIVTIDIVE